LGSLDRGLSKFLGNNANMHRIDPRSLSMTPKSEANHCIVSVFADDEYLFNEESFIVVGMNTFRIVAIVVMTP